MGKKLNIAKRRSIRRQTHYETRTNKQIVDLVYDEFEDHRSLNSLSKKYNIPRTTLQRWFKTFLLDRDWRPYFTENHGLHNRIFTNDLGGFLIIILKNEFMFNGRYLF